VTTNRRWSELESPTYVAEVGDEQVFRVELPGFTVPVAATDNGTGGRFFSDLPVDEVDEPVQVQDRTGDKTKAEQPLPDPLIAEGSDTLDAEPRLVERIAKYQKTDPKVCLRVLEEPTIYTVCLGRS
jgi:hypothetical protein